MSSKAHAHFTSPRLTLLPLCVGLGVIVVGMWMCLWFRSLNFKNCSKCSDMAIYIILDSIWNFLIFLKLFLQYISGGKFSFYSSVQLAPAEVSETSLMIRHCCHNVSCLSLTTGVNGMSSAPFRQDEIKQRHPQNSHCGGDSDFEHPRQEEFIPHIKLRSSLRFGNHPLWSVSILSVTWPRLFLSSWWNQAILPSNFLELFLAYDPAYIGNSKVLKSRISLFVITSTWYSACPRQALNVFLIEYVNPF